MKRLLKEGTDQYWFSPSDINAYQGCERRWYFRSILGLRPKPEDELSHLAVPIIPPPQSTQPMDWGKAFHEVRAARGKGVPLDKAVEDAKQLLKEDPTGLRTPEMLELYCEAMETLYPPSFTSIQTEWAFSWPLLPNIHFRGVIDDISQDSDGLIWPGDYKTTSRKSTSMDEAAVMSWQYRGYACAVSALRGEVIDRFLQTVVVVQKTAGETKNPFSGLISMRPITLAPLRAYYTGLRSVILEILEQINATKALTGCMEHCVWAECSKQCDMWNRACDYLPICTMGGSYWENEEFFAELYNINVASGSDAINFTPIPCPWDIINNGAA